MSAVGTTSGARPQVPVDRRAGGAYRGRDRRGMAASTGSNTSLLIGIGLLGGIVVTALLFRNVADPDVVDVQRVLLLGVSALVAALTGVLCLLRRRVTGEAPVLWLAAGLLVLGVSRIAALLDVATDPLPPDRITTAVYGAGTLLCVVLVIQALRSPPVDSRLRAMPVLAGT